VFKNPRRLRLRAETTEFLDLGGSCDVGLEFGHFATTFGKAFQQLTVERCFCMGERVVSLHPTDSPSPCQIIPPVHNNEGNMFRWTLTEDAQTRQEQTPHVAIIASGGESRHARDRGRNLDGKRWRRRQSSGQPVGSGDQ
jgi:hypothetical protein